MVWEVLIAVIVFLFMFLSYDIGSGSLPDGYFEYLLESRWKNKRQTTKKKLQEATKEVAEEEEGEFAKRVANIGAKFRK
jgi:hypothetical protein